MKKYVIILLLSCACAMAQDSTDVVVSRKVYIDADLTQNIKITTKKQQGQLLSTELRAIFPIRGISFIAPMATVGYNRYTVDTTVYTNLDDYSSTGSFVKVGFMLAQFDDHIRVEEEGRYLCSFGASIVYSRFQERGAWRLPNSYWGDKNTPIDRTVEVWGLEFVQQLMFPLIQNRLYVYGIMRENVIIQEPYIKPASNMPQPYFYSGMNGMFRGGLSVGLRAGISVAL